MFRYLATVVCFWLTANSPGIGGSSPSPISYQASPSPSGYGGYSPMTPGAPFTPQTPGTAMDHSIADWHTNDIEVRIRETHDDSSLIHQTGVIRSVTVCHLNVHSIHSSIL